MEVAGSMYLGCVDRNRGRGGVGVGGVVGSLSPASCLEIVCLTLCPFFKIKLVHSI